MAGSFDIFRKYQRSLLVFVAILAMLAFFVLPPFLQMGTGMAGTDPVVATWSGGELRESGIARATAMRSVLNQFLLDAVAAAGRDPGRTRLLPDEEEDVVRTMLLAEEARANGLVVSNTAINEFLAQWTNDMVGPAQFEEIIARRRSGPFPVSPSDVFDALRTVLLANRMERLFLTGFAGDPPGQRWDYFRRLEQAANVEVVPVVVERFADQVAAPSRPALEAFFARHQDSLPEARSPDPGFKEPHRVSFDYLVASRAALEQQSLEKVTDEQVKEFYEANKERLYKARPPAAQNPDAEKPDPSADAKPPETAKPESAPSDPKPSDPKPEDPKPEDDLDPEAFEAVDDENTEAAVDAPSSTATNSEPQAEDQAEEQGESKPADAPAAKPEEKPGTTPDSKSESKPEAKPEAKPADKPADKPDAKPADKPEQPAFEPLEKVADEIRRRLAGEDVTKRTEATFATVTAEVSRYAEDRALWQARVTPGATPPPAPNVDTLAEKYGLTGGRSRRVDRTGAIASGEIASSFELVPDPASPMGFRQVNWVDQMFFPGMPLLRPVGSRGISGDRYLAWKTEDQPAFVPSFDVKREEVERAWRIVEARPRARKAAEAIVGAAGSGTLAEAAAAAPEPRFEAVSVGPFSWLERGGQPFGSPPTPSQPEALSMPGDEFMKAVFSLEPGGTAVAFNEPRTVCYAIRLVSFEPDESVLRERFLDSRVDQRRLAPIAQQEEVRAVDAWIKDIEKRYALTWKRPPRER